MHVFQGHVALGLAQFEELGEAGDLGQRATGGGRGADRAVAVAAAEPLLAARERRLGRLRRLRSPPPPPSLEKRHS